MAVETPPRFTRGSAEQRGATAPRWSGDDSVPRGLAVASAVMLRLLIVVGGLALFAMAAQRLLLVVLPFLIALLISTLLSPLARRLERSGLRPAAAAAAAVIVAVLVFAGLWALIIPAAVSQGDELAARVQEGLGEVADAFAPLGVDSRDLDRAVDQAVGAARHEALPAAMLAAQWAGAIVLMIVLTFIAAFFPIIGATVAGVAAVLVALVSNGLLAACVILAVILLVQQLEGNVFYPIVVGRRLRLHPVAILLALTAGGVLAGVAGAFLAVPALSVGSAVLDYARERREANEHAAVLSP